ncbi:MAG: hypothetical protein ACK40V_10700, partial [Anaerolineales bacterium]
MPAGRILLAVFFVIGVLGVLISGSSLYSRFIYISVSLFILTWVWTRWLVNKIWVERTARELRANVGDIFEERYKLTNNSRIPAAWIEIINQSKIPYAAGSRLLTLVMGKQKRTYNAYSWLTQRGGFQLGPTAVTIGDLFGIFTTSKIIPTQDTLGVLPMIHEIQFFPS